MSQTEMFNRVIMLWGPYDGQAILIPGPEYPPRIALGRADGPDYIYRRIGRSGNYEFDPHAG